MAISAKELPKNHTDKERFAAASSCIATDILTLLFARKRRRSTVPVPYQPPRSRSRRVPDLKVPIISIVTQKNKKNGKIAKNVLIIFHHLTKLHAFTGKAKNVLRIIERRCNTF